MKNIYTLLLVTLFTFAGYAQETTVYFGMNGKDVYYKTDTNVYLAGVGFIFENDILTTFGGDNYASFTNIYGYRDGDGLQVNQNFQPWTVTLNQDEPKKVLMYGTATEILKPTNGEFVKFLTLTNENTIVEIFDSAAFISDDTTMEESESLTPTAVVDNTLKLDDITDVKIAPYPNPITGDYLHISGLTQTMQATIYDLTGKVVSSSQVTPSDQTMDVSILTSNLYFLNIAKGRSSKTFKILKK